jgi:hypothetical protein
MILRNGTTKQHEQTRIRQQFSWYFVVFVDSSFSRPWFLFRIFRAVRRQNHPLTSVPGSVFFRVFRVFRRQKLFKNSREHEAAKSNSLVKSTASSFLSRIFYSAAGLKSLKAHQFPMTDAGSGLSTFGRAARLASSHPVANIVRATFSISGKLIFSIVSDGW